MFVAPEVKGLVSVQHIQANVPIIEVLGNFWLLDEFQKSNRTCPVDGNFMLTYRFLFLFIRECLHI
jgi:hypothetical protein